MDEAKVQRMIDQTFRSSMNPGMTACITIVVVVVVVVLIAIFMFQSPQGVRLMQKTKKVAARGTSRKTPVRKIAAAMQQAQGRFRPMEENEDRLSPIPGIGRRVTSPVPSMLQSRNNRQFSGMQESDRLSPIPGMRASGQKPQAKPQAMFTSAQIRQGLNNASVQNASPQQQVTRMPRGNNFLNQWLHGDVNRRQSRAGPVVSTQSMWQELP